MIAPLPVIAIANGAATPPPMNAASASVGGVRSQRSAWCRNPQERGSRTEPEVTSAVVYASSNAPRVACTVVTTYQRPGCRPARCRPRSTRCAAGRSGSARPSPETSMASRAAVDRGQRSSRVPLLSDAGDHPPDLLRVLGRVGRADRQLGPRCRWPSNTNAAIRPFDARAARKPWTTPVAPAERSAPSIDPRRTQLEPVPARPRVVVIFPIWSSSSPRRPSHSPR